MPADARRTVTTLDADALARLRELDPDGSRGVLPRILAVYEASLVRALDQLASRQGIGRASHVCDLAHTLKSSSASVGAVELAAACADVERRLRPLTEDPSAALPTDPQLDVDSDRMQALIEAALAGVRTMLAHGHGQPAARQSS